ncbi:hypothetical protein MW887_000206 [Aspergillus wentii]|nr:hypothetical protein MW887_000206 [Aspergillus wentii]
MFLLSPQGAYPLSVPLTPRFDGLGSNVNDSRYRGRRYRRPVDHYDGSDYDNRHLGWARQEAASVPLFEYDPPKRVVELGELDMVDTAFEDTPAGPSTSTSDAVIHDAKHSVVLRPNNQSSSTTHNFTAGTQTFSSAVTKSEPSGFSSIVDNQFPDFSTENLGPGTLDPKPRNTNKDVVFSDLEIAVDDYRDEMFTIV